MVNTVSDERKCFAASLVKNLAPIINPGKSKLKVHTFGYRRFLEDGRSFGFCDNDSWNRTFYDQFVGVKLTDYERDLDKFMNSGRTYLLRTGTPDQKSHFLKALYEKNVWNTLVFPFKNPAAHCFELFFLSTDRTNTNIIEEYVNELKFIRQWITIIHSELQIQVESSWNISSRLSQYFATTITNEACLKKLKTFLQVPTELSALELPLNERILSEREYEILTLLVKKYKRRQIAMHLNLSPKTIDTYIARIKDKTKTLSKTSLLRILENNLSASVDESLYELLH